ncbi:hypothetical protein GCM10011360_04340 [Primorskyibacter flagellatus]|uniref:Uncharacterized protein n=1 Tax=Primorskyibacter flagellatus TaxID=1387277 RepID=A0A916ZY31_9RHOB|nr:hypothetical protein [Primorskyibacter flagellatus]GGE18725.1 hypothetical protein GCM10011360_04340 [Primorskyibacter flagellatus]
MLSIDIDGIWEPSDFSQVLNATESMYYKLDWYGSGRRGSRRSLYYLDPYFITRGLISEGEHYAEALDRLNLRIVEEARLKAYGAHRLYVERIQYNSPGGIDLLGIGKACESIANGIGRMVRYYDERKVRRERDAQEQLETERRGLEIERDRETLRSLKIKNARDMLELERDFPEEAREALIPLLVRDQDVLAEKIADGRITNARTIKSDFGG